MPHVQTDRETACVSVADTDWTGESPPANLSLSESHACIEEHCIRCSDGAVVPGCPDGGQLLGSRKDQGSLRSGQPDPDDGAGSGHIGFRVDGSTAPLTRSPYDPWHSEEYLIACLVRTHGWYWREPRVLAGPWRRPRVHCFMQPEGL